MDLHPDGHPSESLTCTGPIPDGYKRKIAYTGPTLTVIPQDAPGKTELAHNDCSELAWKGLHPNDHTSESIAYTGPTLTATRKNSLYGSYPEG